MVKCCTPTIYSAYPKVCYNITGAADLSITDMQQKSGPIKCGNIETVKIRPKEFLQFSTH